MKSRYFFLTLSVVLLLMKHIHAVPSTLYEKGVSVAADNDRIQVQFIREKRAPLGKLALLGGAALVGKKALLLGGAAVGAKALVGAKTLVGAKALGAGLYKAKYYSGDYGDEHMYEHHEWYRR